jgi:hypothetical protein
MWTVKTADGSLQFAVGFGLQHTDFAFCIGRIGEAEISGDLLFNGA